MTRFSFSLPLVIATLATSLSAYALAPSDQMGDIVPSSGADRTIQIQPNTRWVNVSEGETVRFIEGGQEFSVHFNGTASVFQLNDLMPGTLDQPVKVYVAPVNDGGE